PTPTQISTLSLHDALPISGAVLDTMELMNEPSFTERGILQIAEHPTGPFKMPSWPVRFDGRPPKLEPAPLLGQHNAQVLGDWLRSEEHTSELQSPYDLVCR